MTDTLRDKLGACAHKQLKKQLVGEQVWYACECGQKFHVAPWDGRVSVVAALAAKPAPVVMGEGLREAQLRLLLFECIRELSYVQCVENCNSGLCATSLGEDLVQRGIKLLGVRDLHERIEEQLQAERRTAAAESREGGIKVIWHGTTDSHGTNDSKECSTGRVYTDPLMQQAYDEGFAHGAGQSGESQ